MKKRPSGDIAWESPVARPAGGRPVRWLVAAWEWGAFTIGLFVITGLTGLLLALFGSVLRFVLPRRIGRRVGRLGLERASRLIIGYLRVCGLIQCDLGELERLRHERGIIVAPNHPCLLDAVIVMSRLPHTVCIMKASLWNNPVFGGARLAGYIRNDSRTGLIRKSVEALREGGQLLIFPEGTRTVTHPVNEFKRGFALMAREAGVPVQTVFIETDSEAYRKGWPIFKKPDFPVRFKVRLGRRFSITEADDPREWVSKLADYYREELD